MVKGTTGVAEAERGSLVLVRALCAAAAAAAATAAVPTVSVSPPWAALLASSLGAPTIGRVSVGTPALSALVSAPTPTLVVVAPVSAPTSASVRAQIATHHTHERRV